MAAGVGRLLGCVKQAVSLGRVDGESGRDHKKANGRAVQDTEWAEKTHEEGCKRLRSMRFQRRQIWG